MDEHIFDKIHEVDRVVNQLSEKGVIYEKYSEKFVALNIPKIVNIIKIFDYLDNDFAGQETQIKLINHLENAFKRKEIDFIPKIINSFKIYQSFNDFNDFLKSIN